MKTGELIRWKEDVRLPDTSITGLKSARENVGIVINIAWTGNWVWVKWPNLENLQLCRKNALELA